jgi:hypothetical protein
MVGLSVLSVDSASHVGSAFVLTGMVLKPSGQSAIGRYKGSCIRTAPGDGEVFECQLTYILNDGDLYGESVSSSQGPADGVVTGGTGRFAGVPGYFLLPFHGQAPSQPDFRPHRGKFTGIDHPTGHVLEIHDSDGHHVEACDSEAPYHGADDTTAVHPPHGCSPSMSTFAQ